MTTTASRLERAFDAQPYTPNFERMFGAACADLGAVNQALGLDPDDGGAEPIIDAIQVLRDEILGLNCEAGVLRRKMGVIAHELRYYNPAADDYKGVHVHKYWAKEIDAALCPVPVVQFLAADDAESGLL